jgi:hypothetical protein
VATALIGTTTLLIVFTMPETSYIRALDSTEARHQLASKDIASPVHKMEPSDDIKFVESRDNGAEDIPKKRTWIQNLRLFNGVYTAEPILKLFFRPIGLLILPQVLWATLVMAVTVGFLVAISSNFATAYADTYGFKPYQAGLCFISAIVGSFLGIGFGGQMAEKVADVFTRRNNGIREPEMRLPAIAIGLVTAPLSLVLYGVGIQNKLHWMIPTLGLGLCEYSGFFVTDDRFINRWLVNFSIVLAVNVSFVYTVDSYRPIGGEIMVTQLAFKGEYLNLSARNTESSANQF